MDKNLGIETEGKEHMRYLRLVRSNIGTKCNSLAQQFIGISTTIDTWATCFDSYRVIFRPSKTTDPILQGSPVHCGIPSAYIVVIGEKDNIRNYFKRIRTWTEFILFVVQSGGGGGLNTVLTLQVHEMPSLSPVPEF